MLIIAPSDVHIYHFQKNLTQQKFAKELWERIRRECKLGIHHPLQPKVTSLNPPTSVPELRIYRFFTEPLGPHPIAMFEVNLFTPAQFGAFVPWLVYNRGPLSVLIHPNTVNPVTGEHDQAERDHSEWLLVLEPHFAMLSIA